MTGLMFDSDQISALADSRTAGCRVATYADLLTHEIVQQFAGRLVVIDRGLGDPLGLAHVADVERGLFTPAQGAVKIRQWIAEKRPFPTVYHNRSQAVAVTAACAPAQPYRWVATLDGTMAVGYGAGVQFATSAMAGFHVDVSVVWNDGWCPIR